MTEAALLLRTPLRADSFLRHPERSLRSEGSRPPRGGGGEFAMKPRKWKTLQSDIAYRTPIFDLHRRRSTHPRRGERDFFILEAPNWVNIIPITGSGEVVIIRRWRHGHLRVHDQVPGGMVDPEDRSPMHAARREMIEETGFDSDTIVELGKVHPNPAIQGNICFSFLADNVRQIERVVSIGDEETEVVLVPMGEMRADRDGQGHACVDDRRIFVPARVQSAEAPPQEVAARAYRPHALESMLRTTTPSQPPAFTMPSV